MKRTAVVLVLLAACSSSGGSAATTTVDPNLPPPSAVASCHSAIESELKSPATAKYDAAGPPLQEAQGPSWHIKGSVDSENGFGALVRSNYDCVVEPGSLTGTAQEWVTDPSVTPQ